MTYITCRWLATGAATRSARRAATTRSVLLGIRSLPGVLPLLQLLVACHPAALTPAASPQAVTAPTAAVPRALLAPEGEAIESLASPEVRATLRESGIDPEMVRCNADVRWDERLSGYAKQIASGIAEKWGVSPDPAALKWAHHHALGYLVRSSYEQTHLHNMGAMRLSGYSYSDSRGAKRPVVVFRSGLILGRQGPSACFDSLIRSAGVRHVLNLYTGTFPFRDLIEAEQVAAQRLGATYFDAATASSGNWRQLVEEEEDFHKNLPQVMRQLATLIREQVLLPGGQPPRGNIYLHCGGGMHRSGMVFGVLRRCINHDPLPLIEKEYRHHTGWISDKSPGGFEPLNLQLIRQFDCSLLTP